MNPLTYWLNWRARKRAEKALRVAERERICWLSRRTEASQPLSKGGGEMARTPATLIRAIEKQKRVLERASDVLREIESEAEELRALSDDAVDSLEYAIDRLSEQV